MSEQSPKSDDVPLGKALGDVLLFRLREDQSGRPQVAPNEVKIKENGNNGNSEQR